MGDGRMPQDVNMPPRPLTGVTLLVVDDHEDSRDFVQVALEHEGAEVRIATSANRAARLAAGGHHLRPLDGGGGWLFPFVS